MKKSNQILAVLFVFCLILPITSVFATEEDSWTALKPIPVADGNWGVAVVKGKIYAIGGGVNYEYNPATDTWVNKTPMSFPRWDFGITVFQNKIYVIGGGYSKDGHPDAFEIYDPATDSWTSGAPMPNFEGFGIADITSAVVDNKIYVFSCGDGSNYSGLFTQIYDPETDSWSSGAPIPVMIDYASAVATSGVFAPKTIHVLGVHYIGHEVGESEHQIYDPVQDTWANGTALSVPRHSLGLTAINDQLYAIGGSYEGTISYENLMFTPAGYIPEFSSWTLLIAGFLITILVSMVYRRRINQGKK